MRPPTGVLVYRAMLLWSLATASCSPHASRVAPSLGLSWPVATYEAESGQLAGGARVVGSADERDRLVGDLGGEASHRQAVVLTAPGDSVSWVTQGAQGGANAIVLRFSIPDAPDGGGAGADLDLSVQDPSGRTRYQHTLQLTSRYAWLYGGVMDGTKLFNVPASAATYATASSPTHLYDEVQLELAVSLREGDVTTLAKTGSGATVAIDFVELETLPPPLPQPTGFLSIADPRCGALPLDTRQTGSAFDGADDSSYGSQFNSVLGNNPYNPASFAVIEKDYYSTAPGKDTLQDSDPNAIAGGLSMFELANHNYQSLETCLNLALAPGSLYSGVWIPPGRFYLRGALRLPSGITIQGAGMWYSKLSAVDTAAPSPVTVNGRTGIAGLSGNLVLESQPGGSDRVTLSNFSMFGNVTQRDVVDSTIPVGIHGEFTNSTFDNLWVEHYFTGINANQGSRNVRDLEQPRAQHLRGRDRLLRKHQQLDHQPLSISVHR